MALKVEGPNYLLGKHYKCKQKLLDEWFAGLNAADLKKTNDTAADLK